MTLSVLFGVVIGACQGGNSLLMGTGTGDKHGRGGGSWSGWGGEWVRFLLIATANGIFALTQS